MAFAKILTFFNSILSAQTIEPSMSKWDFIGVPIGVFFQQAIESVVSLFYWVVKWVLALVDFLQYFVQKLIGLDYWLNNNVYSFEGAVESDLLFSFLYNDTVQNVFRALCGVFIVLLIVFTIAAIIKSEWTYITGESFGDGKGNSKSKIMVNSMKAIAWVLVFPLILIVGIISSNAILASLVKALSIDMGSTFGSTLFYIGSQSANKYKIYADGGVRTPVSDEVTFYINENGQYLTLGTGSPTDLVYPVNNYATFLDELENAKKYTVNSIFKKVKMDDGNFSGYCVRLMVEGEPVYYLVKCSDSEKEAMYYYLRNVLQVPVMNKNDNIGSKSILSEVKGYMDDSSESKGYIKNKDLNDYLNKDAITQAAWNTWTYPSIFEEQKSFDSSIDVSVLQNDYLKKLGITSVSNAKIMYNSDLISSYFDGGMFGAEQLQAEYSVMGEVVDFMNNTGTKLYILDATSPLINWSDTKYQVDNRWLADFTHVGDNLVDADLKNTGNKHTRYVFNGTGDDPATDVDEVMPLLVSYSEMCADSEQGNVLYVANKGKSNELKGSIYIMCIKQTEKNGSKAEYLPLVNGKTYENPVDKSTFNFKSDYYASNYRGVVIAKGNFDTSSLDGTVGLPTYLKSANSFTETKGKKEITIEISDDEPYYYEMVQTGGLLQFGVAHGLTSNDYTVKTFTLSQQDLASKYTIKKMINTEGLTYFEDNETGEKSMSADLITNLTIEFDKGGTPYMARFAGETYGVSSTVTNYLFKFETTGEYFVVEATTPTGFKVKSVSAAGEIVDNGTSETVRAVTQNYDLLSVYKNGNTPLTNPGAYNATHINRLRPDQLVYNTRKNGKSVFKTESMEWVNDTRTNQYVYIYFDTGFESLVKLSETKVDFAKPVEPTYTVNNRDATDYSQLGYVLTAWDANYMQNSVFYTFYLYNYYTAQIGDATSNTYREYKDGSIIAASRPSDDDEKKVFKVKVNADGFEWHTNDDSLGLYDGGTYVGTIYKPIGTACNTKEELLSVSTSMYFDRNDKTYYNLRTTNRFLSEDAMKLYYDNLSDSFVTACVRTNLGSKFWELDFQAVKIIKFRTGLAFGLREVKRDQVSTVFKVSDGLAFDYFFENDIKLQTFYVPSKISYWVILIASALIIKVLGTSIWGVIKRFYEITLYFVAMPAVASTIPLDGGSRFKSSILTPMIQKVLMTYGVILGINMFFVLLAPIKSISNIFTPEDIATSGSYFLKHLPISYKLLNLYVYILFILVAFTMINALPSMIQTMVSGSGDDLLKSGAQVKQDVGKNLKEAGDFMSGKSGIEFAKKAKETALSSIPGGEFIKKGGDFVKDKAGKITDAIKRGATKGEEKLKGPTSRQGGDEEENTETTETTENNETETNDPKNPPKVENQIPVGETLNDDQILEAAKQGMSVVSDGKGGFMVDPSSVQPEGEELTPEQEEEITKNEFDENVINNENFVGGGNNEEIEKNVVENNTDKQEIIDIVQAMLQNFAKQMNVGGSSSEQVNTALFGGKDQNGNAVQGKVDAKAQVEAITSTMTNEERQQFEKNNAGKSDDDKLAALQTAGYDLQANVDANGNINGFNVTKTTTANGQTTKETKAVAAEAQATILANAVTHSTSSEVAVATSQTGSEAAVSKILANNVMQGIDIKNVDETSTLAGAITAFAMKDDSIIDEAMLESMDKKELEKFMRKYHINGTVDNNGKISSPEARAQALQTISQLRHSDKGQNEFNTMDPSKYQEKVFGVVQKRAENGEFSVSAWQLQKEMDPNSINEMIEKTSANRKSQNNDVVDGTNTKEHQNILNNVAQNLIDINPNSPMAKMIQNAAFAGQLTSQDLEDANLDAIRAITGKNSIAELTDEDKALLGFVKTFTGGITDINGNAFDEKTVKGFKADFGNFMERQAIFNTISKEDKTKAYESSGISTMLENTAKNDVTMAMEHFELLEAESDFILKDKKLNKNETQALANILGIDVTTLNGLNGTQLQAKLNENSTASEFVRNIMKKDEATVEKLSKQVNQNYEKSYARTDEEKAYELELSKQEIKAGSVDTIYQAFMNSNVVQGEEKTEMIKNMLTAFNGTTTTQDVMADLKANGVTAAQIDQMKRAGFSEEDIAMAYQAAALSGNANGVTGSNLASMVTGYLSDSEKMQKDLLSGMQKQGGAEYTRAVDSLMNENLSEEQKNSLVENVANSSINGFNKTDQDTILVEMAKADGKMMDKIRGALGLNANAVVSDSEIQTFLNNNAYKHDRESLEKRANRMSYYELNHRFIKKDVSSAEQLYQNIENGNKKAKEVDKIIATQGDLVETQSILEQLKKEGKNSEAINLIAEKYSQSANVLSKEEKSKIEIQAKLEKMKQVLGTSTTGAKDIVSAMGLNSNLVDTAGVGAALEYIQGNHNDAYLELIKNNSKFATMKGKSINQLTYAEKFKVYNELKKGTYGSLNINAVTEVEKIKKTAETNYAIEQFIQHDEQNQEILNVAAEGAIEEENKLRLAHGAGGRAYDIGRKLWTNNKYKKVKKEASDLFKKLNNGKSIEEVDENTRNSFLAEHFSDSLEQGDIDSIDDDYLRRMGVNDANIRDTIIKDARKNNQSVVSYALQTGAIKRVAKDEINKKVVENMTVEDLDQVMTNINKEEMGEGKGTDVINSMKKKYVEEHIDDMGNKIFEIPDVSKMTREEKRNYDFNRNMIMQQIKPDANGQYSEKSKDILVNLYKNSSLINDEETFNNIIKEQFGDSLLTIDKLTAAQKLALLKKSQNYSQKFAEEKAKNPTLTDTQINQKLIANATLQELKEGLDKEKVFEYVNKDQKVKEKLLAVGASDITLTLDKSTQNSRKVDVVKNNTVLNNQVVEKVLEGIDDNKIKQLIEAMLKKQDPTKFGSMSPAQMTSYINANFTDLKSELALHNFDVRSGKVGNYNENNYIKAITALEQTNKLFQKQVYNNVTHSVSYASNASEEDKDIFFTSEANREIKEARKNNKVEKGRRKDKKRRLQDGIEDFIAGGSDPNVNFGEVYTKKRRLPKNSAAYENWNKALNKKIEEIKLGVGEYAGMTKGQRQAEIAKLESRIIYLNGQKPKNYDSMTVKEKIDFEEQQKLNMNDAMNAGKYSKVYKKKVKVSKTKTKQVSEKFVEEKGANYTYGTKIDTKRKKKHNDTLIDIDEKIARYNATAPLRKKDRDFGSEFEKFASNYLTPNQLKTMMKRYGLATDDQYKKETDPVVQIAMREKRERAMALYMNELRRTAAKKVQKDGKKPVSFLVERGIDVDTAVYGSVRYKDGSKKLNKQRSKIQKEAHRKRVRKKSDAARVASENEVINNERLGNELLEFNKTYTGPANQYINLFKTHLESKGFNTKSIEKFISKFRAKNALLGNIQDKALSIQQRELAKWFAHELNRAQRRLKAPRNIIPASPTSEGVGKFVGKTLTGATTSTEVKLHSQYATEFDKAMSIFARNASQVVDIRTLINSLPFTVQSAIRKNLEDKLIKEQNMQNRMKMLENFLKRELAKAKKRVNKDNFFKSERQEFTKLGGVLRGMYVKKDAIQNSTMYGPAFARLNTTDQKVHESLVANETAIKNKLKIEEDKLRSLIQSLSSAKTIADRRLVRKTIESTETKVNLYKKMLASAETRRREFEKTISDANDRMIKARGGAMGASNRGSVLDEYIFTKGGVRVEKGSVDARQIEQIIKKYMANQAAIFNKMSASYTSKAVNDLKVKIDRLRYSMSNDFGKNLRDLKRVQTELKETMDALKASNKAEYDEILKKLRDDDYNLELVEKNLVQKLKQMGIDINEVRRYTNR